MAAGGRVAGKSGVVARVGEGYGTARINEDIIWLTICLGIIILVLITLALCYILHEKCKKRKCSWAPQCQGLPLCTYSREYYIDA